MQKTQSEQISTTAHRKVASTPYKSRKNMKRPTLGEMRSSQTQNMSQTPATTKAPAQKITVQKITVQKAPIKQAQMQQMPAQHVQAQQAPAQQVQARQAQMQHASAQQAQTQSAPMQQAQMPQAQMQQTPSQQIYPQKTPLHLAIQKMSSTKAQQAGMMQKSESQTAQSTASMVNMAGIHERMRRRAQQMQMKQQKQTAKQVKQQEIQKALKAASATPKQKKTKKSDAKFHFGFGRVMLAFACAAVAVFAIVYFVNLNSPDISLKVAAMQTGIEASYPSYIPRDFSLSDITSENGRVTLNFSNPATGDAYTIVEEKSSWDSNALLSNYVKKTYGEDYTTIRENGLTIYIHNSDATWVNGGVVYKLQCKSGSLTKKQLRAIAVSL